MSYIIGIDLALANTGVAVFDTRSNCILELTTVKTEKTKQIRDLLQRCKLLFSDLLDILNSYPIDNTTTFVVEIPGGSQSSSAATAMSSAVGVYAGLNTLFSDSKYIHVGPKAIKSFVGNFSVEGSKRKNLNISKAEECFPSAPFLRNNKNVILRNQEHVCDAALLVALFLQGKAK